MEKEEKWVVRTVVYCILSALLPTVALVIVINLWIKHPKVEYYEFNINETKTEETCKYDMLPCEMSDYICKLCDELDLDSDLVVAILLKENPELNPDAIHRNDNGSTDLGLFQQNDKYIWSVFVPAYWKINEDYNPYNWKMNTYLSCKHIAYLKSSLKIFDDIVCAYNCGEGRTMSGDIPSSTRNYLATVKNTYRMLKEIDNGRERRKETSE